MSGPGGSRKRPAPGTGPMMALPQVNNTSNNHDDQIIPWNGGGLDDTSFGANNTFGIIRAPIQYNQNVPTPSNAIARRPNPSSQALIPTPQRQQNFAAMNGSWNDYQLDTSSLLPQQPNSMHHSNSNNNNSIVNTGNGSGEHDTIEVLEERAQKAKADALAKRKQIPPFVQKLSSFLEERKNEELIRWSENGDSFIVLDEDEFAKTLIPELFKHNNYASFVRQLNMYGFHKRVGLSDNSMRASERKNKSPSEYSNPFFRRGYPNLLWLINKPKNKSRKGIKTNDVGEADSEEDGVGNDDSLGHGFGSANMASGRPQQHHLHHMHHQQASQHFLPQHLQQHLHQQQQQPSQQHIHQQPQQQQQQQQQQPQQQQQQQQNQQNQHSQNDCGPLQKKEMAAIREELSQMRQQSKMMINHLSRLQNNNSSLHTQLRNLQDVNDKQENTINAILNFLANVFRKTLEDQAGSQNLNDVLVNMVSNPNGTHSSGIVDLGELVQAAVNPMAHSKKTRGLLPPIPNQQSGGSRSNNKSPSPGTPTPANFRSHLHPHARHEPGKVTELLDTSPGDTPSPQYFAQQLEQNPQESMMKFIHDTNAINTSGMDLPDVVANTPATLSNDQSNTLVQLMAGQNASPIPSTVESPLLHTSAQSQRPPQPRPSPPSAAPATSAATMQPPPPPPPLTPELLSHDLATTSFDDIDPATFSPIMRSLHAPFLELAPTPSDLNVQQMQQLQESNAAKLNQISSRLGSLSPLGRIPGVEQGDLEGYFPELSAEDLEFVNQGDFGGSNLLDFDLSQLDGGSGGAGASGGSAHEMVDVKASPSQDLGSGNHGSDDDGEGNAAGMGGDAEEVPRHDGFLDDMMERAPKRRRG